LIVLCNASNASGAPQAHAGGRASRCCCRPGFRRLRRRLEPAGKAARARKRILRDEPELRELGGHREARRRIGGAGPAQLAVSQGSTRREPGKIGTERSGKRQMRAERDERRELEPLEVELGGIHAIARAETPRESELGRVEYGLPPAW
jgi:hypothetical protein